MQVVEVTDGADSARAKDREAPTVRKNVLLVNRGPLAAGQAKQTALARASAWAMNRENPDV